MAIHWEIDESHRAFCTYCQSVEKNTDKNVENSGGAMSTNTFEGLSPSKT